MILSSKIGIQPSSMILMHEQEKLSDDATIASCKIKDGDVLSLRPANPRRNSIRVLGSEIKKDKDSDY